MGRGFGDLHPSRVTPAPQPRVFPAAVTGRVSRTEPRILSASPGSGQSRHHSALVPSLPTRLLPTPVPSAISSFRGQLSLAAPGSESIADHKEDRATPTKGSPPPDPRRYSPRPSGPRPLPLLTAYHPAASGPVRPSPATVEASSTPSRILFFSLPLRLKLRPKASPVPCAVALRRRQRCSAPPPISSGARAGLEAEKRKPWQPGP